MDPFAHSLAGAALSQAGLKKLTPLATITLVIGANLPDIDVVFHFFGQDAALYYRRGFTHGILATVLLPLALTAIMMIFDSKIRRRWSHHATPINLKATLLLSYVGVISHPFLDWLNTYGVRLLMPFSDTWFYGDTLFIIDAWVWLLLAASVVFAYSASWFGISAWIIAGLASTALITTQDMVPLSAKITWYFGVASIIFIRYRGISATQNQKAALLCIAAILAYLGAMGFGNHKARQDVVSFVSTTSEDKIVETMTGPLPANPFVRHVVVKTTDHYHGYIIRLWGKPRISALYEPVLRPDKTDAIIVQAAQNHDIKGFINWVRYPHYTVTKTAAGAIVSIRDLRYVAPDSDVASSHIGTAQVFVPFD